MSPWFIAFRLVSYALTVIGLGGGIVLFAQSLHRGTDRRVLWSLAFILLMWGLPSLPDCFIPRSGPWLTAEPLGVVSLIGGNLYAIVCLLYPLELARPGWLGFRHIALLLLPYLLLSAFYFIVLAILHQPVRTLHSAMDMLLHFNEFNVWYRLVLYLSTCLYLAYLFLNTGVRALELRDKLHGAASSGFRGLVWLRFYGTGMVCITLAWLFVLLYGNTASLVVHRAIAALFFGIVVCSTVFRPQQAVQTLSEA